MKSRWSGLPRRVMTAVGLAAGSLALIWGGLGFFMLEILLLAMAGSAEFFDLVERKGLRPLRRLGTLAVFTWLLATCFFSEAAMSALALVGFLAFLMLLLARSEVRKSALLDAASTWLGVAYMGWLFSYLVKIRMVSGSLIVNGWCLSRGALLVTFLIVLCTASDTAAYFTGRAFGRRPLCPSISPGKTKEGAAGALLATAWVGRSFGLWLGLDPMLGTLLGCLVSVAAQLGDLWESALKRDAGVKDSGDIIGGHGGVLDRFDSLAFAAPVFYLFGKLFQFF